MFPPRSRFPTFDTARLLARVRATLLATCLSTGAAIAGPVPWPEAPFSHYAENASLTSVLAEFAAGFSLSLSVQPGLEGTVNGRFSARNPTEFISRLSGVYGFTWFTHAGTLYVSKANETITRSLSIPGGGVGNLRQALSDLGVLEPRFGWGELQDKGVVMVSGPPSYVSLMEATLKQLPPASGAQQVAVFRLRHASAEDRTIRYRDSEITQPGLATVLRNLVADRGGTAPTGFVWDHRLNPPPTSRPVTVSSDSGAPVTGSGGTPVTAGSATTVPTSVDSRGASSSRRSDVRSRGPSVQSDPRLNALIIEDIPERIPLYAKVIEQLDVPTALIEIEAMIINVNSDKARELGINWAGRVGNRSAIGFGALNTTPQPGTLSLVHAAAATINPGTVAVNTGGYLIGQIRLLETTGDASVQSRPSVLTSDNTGALLDLSETFYVRLQGERVASLTPVTAGTTLRVTPRLITEGTERFVQLTVDIEDGRIEDRQVDTLPTVARSTVSTQAIVREDDSLVIAGHTSDSNIESDQKVPFLGDIPGLGVLFSSRARSVQRRERLFIIKPTIISAPGSWAPPPLSQREPARTAP